MGAFADSLFAVLMSWVRALVNSIWALFSSEGTTALEFLGKNWLLIALVIIAAGLLIDWTIWMIRWRPYTLWAQRARRILHIAPPEEDEDDEPEEAPMRSIPARKTPPAEPEVYEDEAEDENWLPERPEFTEAEESEAIRRADEVPDEALGVYPGMRYDVNAADMQPAQDGTRKYAAVHSEGPGAAEVNRRRAEIDAWQLQMQEEARAKREAEQACRMEEMRRAEEARLAKEARLAEEARQAEEARRAQEEYQRQLEEYERQKAQYELELAQYERDKAAYEAAIAAQQRQEAAAELQPELPAQSGAGRARRRKAVRPATYSEMVEGETVEALPETPAWPQMDAAAAQAKRPAAKESKETKKPARQSGLRSLMSHLVEEEEKEVSGVNALPPRVDVSDAYNPATKPGEEPSAKSDNRTRRGR